MKISTIYMTSGVLLALAGAAWAGPAGDSLAGPTDRQIEAIVSAANAGEITAGKYMQSKSEDSNVKEFAEQMVEAHKAVNKSAIDLASKLKIKPEKSDASRDLDKDAKKNMAALKKLSGHDLDKAYVQQEVTAHQAVLDTIDKSLLPNVSNGELKALLEKTRPAVAAHLEHARKLAETM